MTLTEACEAQAREETTGTLIYWREQGGVLVRGVVMLECTKLYTSTPKGEPDA